MEWNEQTYQKIQAYLDDELTTEAEQAFELEMKKNPDLKREVALNKDLEELLADTPENALRKNLQILSDQVIEEKNDKAATWWWLWSILLLCLLVLLGGYVYTKSTVPKEKIEEESIQEQPPKEYNNILDSDIKKPNEIPPIINEKDEPTIPPTKTEPSSPIPKEKESPETTNNALKIYANFQPNPALDFLISNNLRDNDIGFEVEKFTQMDTISVMGTINFQFSGRLTANENLLNQDLKIHIFSNDKAQFQDFLPLFSSDLDLESLNQEIYAFNFQKNYLLKSGLYYFLIENEETERVYFVEKFVVQ